MRPLIDRILEIALLSGICLFVVSFLVLATQHIGYPFELEWMEGGVLDHVERILAGRQLYVAPSLEFTPFIYSPLYFYLGAALSALCGAGFAALRALSMFFSICSFVLIYSIIHDWTKNGVSAFIGAGLFLATYATSGAWLDLARVDSLFLALLLVAVYLARPQSGVWSWVVAGILAALACHTKQVGVIMAFALAVHGFFCNVRFGLAFSIAFILVAGIGVWVLNSMNGSWYGYYVFKLPAYHELGVRNAWPLLRDALLCSFPMVVLTALWLILRSKKERARFGLLTLGMLAIAFFSALHSGSYRNTLLPAHAILSLLFGLAWSKVHQKERGSGQRIAFYLVAILQLGLLSYNPANFIPGKEDQRAGQDLVRQIREIDGPVLIPRHGYLAALASKKSTAHEMAMNDVLKGDREGGGRALFSEIEHALESRKYGAIIVDYNWLQPDVEKFYKKKRIIFADPNLFWPVTGARTRPEFIYTR